MVVTEAACKGEMKINNNRFVFPKGHLDTNGNLVFNNENDYQTALQEGVFFVKIPEEIDVSPGILLSENFYVPQKTHSEISDYQGFSSLHFDDSILGYSDRDDQVEQLQLELSLWHAYFPNKLVTMLYAMNQLGLSIIQHIFNKIGVKHEYWPVITGNAAKNKALQYCIFNHYRSGIKNVGITRHKDSGFITVLYSPENGLEAYREGNWYPIEPEPGYFTINLGHAFEVLTAKLSMSVKAVDHRVKEITKLDSEPDRYSFGTYIGPRFDMNLYQCMDDKLVFYKTFLEFQRKKAKEMGYEFHPKVKVD